MTALSGLATDVGTLFSGTAFGGGAIGQIAQSVAVTGAGTALVAGLSHPDVIAKLDPLGITNIFHPSGAVAPPATPVTAAQAAVVSTGFYPATKTFTYTWGTANPTLAPLYIAQGWQAVAG